MKHFSQLLTAMVALLAHMCRLIAPKGATRYRTAQGLTEYAIILVLVAIVVAGAVTSTGRRVSSTYEEINCTLARENGEGPTNNGRNRACSTNPGNRGGG